MSEERDLEQIKNRLWQLHVDIICTGADPEGTPVLKFRGADTLSAEERDELFAGLRPFRAMIGDFMLAHYRDRNAPVKLLELPKTRPKQKFSTELNQKCRQCNALINELLKKTGGCLSHWINCPYRKPGGERS